MRKHSKKVFSKERSFLVIIILKVKRIYQKSVRAQVGLHYKIYSSGIKVNKKYYAGVEPDTTLFLPEVFAAYIFLSADSIRVCASVPSAG